MAEREQSSTAAALAETGGLPQAIHPDDPRAMTACRQPPPGAPRFALTLAGSGEPLLRLEKRLSCAAAGLGLALDVEIRKDAETLGIPFEQTPAVLVDGKMAFTGLPRTEEIEDWLREKMNTLKKGQA
ncbi:MAG: thioredoxin family protein [Sulfuricella sp.]|jgi:hypothetical protein|nr:thioredoxin family protein [Sulfuricella sp.]